MTAPRNQRTKGLQAHLIIERSESFTLDFALDIEPGETAVILGPNGAGKSTTVQALAGLLPLDGGEIVLDGRCLDRPADNHFVGPEDRFVGVVFQDYLLFEHLSVIDNITFGPTSRRQDRGAAERKARALLEVLGLADLAQQRPSQISGGQAQRVALARALATEPNLLLLDEPLAALDVATRNDLRRVLIEQLDGFVGPRLLITHDPTDAFLLANKIHVIEGGRVAQTGSAEDIRLRPATPYVAALAGTNFFAGVNQRGTITLDDYDLKIHTADLEPGPVQVSIHPRAIALHLEQPDGSPRNSWRTTISHIEPLGETTRVQLKAPLPLIADITPGAKEALALEPGKSIWVAIKATEIRATALNSNTLRH